ncbi:AAA family ATPase [Millisia brevis]|uniref:AAA family ATPase n=1 Tax=Millisia brevis TaxID=264148 RepID=UPI00082FAA7F|nr:SMC family ATPase [Millisia brevis]
MRLHSLTITAFGPFAGTVSVDFDRLGSDGLFLLHGQTGAGKTSILDAIAFALYGAVPGARSDAKRLLSDHAPAGTAPKVTLEATLSGRRIRIVRSPEYVRPKRRGTGTTKANASATLTWLDGRGTNLTRHDEIGDEINRLLGMSAAQFFQVVLLPQGEFAKFLRASTDDRSALLERLFDTERFRSIEEWLQDRRRRSEENLRDKAAHVDRISERFAQAAGVDTCDDGDPVAWAQTLVVQEKARARQAGQTVARIRGQREAAAADLARLTGIERARERGSDARRVLAALAADAERHAARGRELAAAGRVGPIASLIDAEESAAGRRLSSRAAVERARAGLAALPDGPALLDLLPTDGGADRAGAAGGADRDGESDGRADAETDAGDRALRVLDEHATGWATVIGGLERMLPLHERRDRLAARRTDVVEETGRLERGRDRIAAKLADVPDRIAGLDADIERTTPAARAAGPLRERLAAARTVAEAAAHLEREQDRRRGAVERFEVARAAHQDARELWLTLRERRLDGMAAELAAGLVDGAPCAVCGSVEHPQPAVRAAAAVGKAEEDDARRREQEAEGRAGEAQRLVAEIDRRLSELSGRSNGRSASDAGAEVARLDGELGEALDAERRLEAARKQRIGLDDQRRRWEAELAEGRELLSAALTRCEAIDASLLDIDEQLREAGGSDGSVAARIERYRRLVSAAGALRDALDRERSARRRASQQRADLAAALRDAGFETVDAARAARRDPVAIARIAELLDDAERRRIGAIETLAQPDVVAAEAELPVDLTTARETDALLADALEREISKRETSERRRAEMEDLAAQLWSACDVLAPVRREHTRITGLAEVVAGRGANVRRMSLRSYVLAARLEEVAIAATERFRSMSAGRYGFVHTDGAGPRGTRGGLGLEISDSYTGVIRSAATLSGGESFCASLALALGLSDVVSAEAGGVTLDTMFIDEGFGSLDSEALDAVMGVLDELRAGGRVVGVVSHVDEMRYRIPSRLHVLRERSGSTLEQIAG